MEADARLPEHCRGLQPSWTEWLLREYLPRRGGRGKPIGVDALKIRDDRLVCVDMANSLDFDHDDERCGEDKKWFAA